MLIMMTYFHSWFTAILVILAVLAFSAPLLAVQAQAVAVDTAQRPASVSKLCSKGETQESTTVKSSKSNSSERLAVPPPAPLAVPAEAVILNSSKSNVNRKNEEQDAGEAVDSDC